MPSSRTLLNGNVPLADDTSLRDDFRCTSVLGLVFRRRQDSARKMLILRQDMTHMSRNMSRAASLKLRRGPCDCFIKLCAAAGAMLPLIIAIATPFLSRCGILD